MVFIDQMPRPDWSDNMSSIDGERQMGGLGRDYALVQGPQPGWRMVAHRADCPAVRKLADAGKPVLTMLNCDGPLPESVSRAPCLQEPANL